MNKKGIVIWISSLVVMFSTLIPFINFMFHPAVKNLIITIFVIATGAVLHVVARKMLTHKNGYTVFEAKQFYNQCCSCGLTELKQCKLNADKFAEIAKQNDFSQNLMIKDLFEMYSIGCNFINNKKG